MKAYYRVNKDVMIYVKGGNLLAQKYEINAGYLMPKAMKKRGMKVML